MLPETWQAVRRILAVRQDNVGDIVMLGPALRAIRQNLPHAAITLLCSPAGSKAAPLLPWVDDILVQRPIWQDVNGALPFCPSRELETIQSLRRGQFDAALLFTSFSQSPWPAAMACYLAGIPIRAGQSKEFGGSVLSNWVRPRADELHQVDRNLALLDALGFSIRSRQLEIRVPPAAQDDSDALLAANGVDPCLPFILLAPGASCPARRYPAAQYAAVARLIANEGQLPVVVSGSERERELVAAVASGSPGVIPLEGRDTVPVLAGILSRAALLIGNNSAPMHLADALGTPMLILYAGTDRLSQWRPRKAPARLLTRSVTCSPCYEFHCLFTLQCLDFTPSDVAAQAIEMLSELPEAMELA